MLPDSTRCHMNQPPTVNAARLLVPLVALALVTSAAEKEPPRLLPITPLGPGLQLSRLFNDHMVLQREMPVKVWGWANAGDEVTVAFAGQTKSAKAGADGRWVLQLEPMAASAEGRELVVTIHRPLERPSAQAGGRAVRMVGDSLHQPQDQEWPPREPVPHR